MLQVQITLIRLHGNVKIKDYTKIINVNVTLEAFIKILHGNVTSACFTTFKLIRNITIPYTIIFFGGKTLSKIGTKYDHGHKLKIIFVSLKYLVYISRLIKRSHSKNRYEEDIQMFAFYNGWFRR